MASHEQASVEGIGGWLLLVVLGLIVTPIRLGYFLLNTHLPLFSDGTWLLLTSPDSSAYHPLWAPLLIFEVLANLTLLLLALTTLWLLFHRSRRTPWFAIAWLALSPLFITTDYFLAELIPVLAGQSDPDSAREAIHSTVAALIWIPYFLVSKRVKATFVR